MKVCIAEKPSVAKEIAEIVGARTKKDGYFEGNGYQVTWTFGHLCTLKEPHEYTPQWKQWTLRSLPMIPSRFGIKLITDPGIEKQFKIIETLMSQAEAIINCGDAGQEGELIQRWVMQKAACQCPVYRLWISSLTEESIREGFQRLKNQEEFNSLYYAGLSRAIGDWLLGMNATRLYTLKYGQNRQVLSIGRVQTPTLALIVNRQLEIENFVPQPYWELKTVYRDTTFSVTKGRFSSVEEGENFLKEVEGFPFEVTDISTKQGKEYPPRLFDLTSLQVECNKKFGFSAEDTLKLIQSLYEKKVTTYPRVDTTFLSDDIYPKVPGILEALQDYTILTSPLKNTKIPKSKKVFDNSKVTDHHAIIPTNVRAGNLTQEEAKIYDLVARRFIAAFYPDCQVANTTVLGQVNSVEFKVTGKQILYSGWRVVFDKEDISNNKEENEERTLPAFVKGESGPHEPALTEKWTQPPKLYTEATLLRAMETAGKLVEDDELRDALKENGIGRPSTRAAIIETLFKRHYIRKERKNLIATSTGIELIQTIHEELLKSAELTGIWENKLRKIERNEYAATDFLTELKQMVSQIVHNVLSDNTYRSIPFQNPETEKIKKEKNTEKIPSTSKSRKKEKTNKQDKISDTANIPCPVCGNGYILKGKSAFGCSEWKNGCTFRINFDGNIENLSQKELLSHLKTYNHNNAEG
ncbi:MAG: DNA topoisomerase III [Coprobacter sp.]|jgi:DNA topoisomerase III|uniref:DNA topoisomerase 3 n=1 Tax=Barnesiella propionica TaxID=2981781 RepID=UPI000D79DE76|nr:DNA topoisomerase 3 [Barnesiella propionica]MBO1734623.1 DNA topoisomerase 3 [Barnesiella sp. GGCC_0306]MBS7039638.1 DNA topoisomerase 3 [Bacteroidales bacterium]MCU6768112.1 DNA topoisomerase 3 [Barnesiella propionica]PWM88324.1 MAG: DNA topoisomerase III [Coprobacter sp.]